MVMKFNILNVPKIFFGENSVEYLKEILTNFDNPKILLITGSGKIFNNEHSQKLIDLLKKSSKTIYHEKIYNEPTIEDIDNLVNIYKEKEIDIVIGFGGGSALDAGKAVSAMLPLKSPIIDYLEGVGNKKHPGTKIKYIAIPTTAGTGSEATNNAVIMKPGEDGFKKSLRHENFIPDIAIVDPIFTITLPPEITVISGLDALSQLIESYTSTKSNLYICSIAETAIVEMIKNLEIVLNESINIAARTILSYSALISGISLTNAGLGLVHGLASPLGHILNAPHGLICGNLLGPVNKYLIKKAIETKNYNLLEKYIKISKGIFENVKNDQKAIDKILEYFESVPKIYNLKPLKYFMNDYNLIKKLSEKFDQKNSPIDFTKEDVNNILLEVFK